MSVIEELQKGPEELKREVIDSGWCVSCGACVELCPYIKSQGDKVAFVHNCSIKNGNCYIVCPRTYTDYEFLSQATIGTKQDVSLGVYREIVQARSSVLNINKQGQYGGVVTALITLALEKGIVDAALLTSADKIYPHWTLARNRKQAIEAAGSKYGLCPGLSGLNQALRNNNFMIAVVGRPCQVVALRKMQQYSSIEGREKVGLILGLICFWGLDYRFYDDLHKEYGVNRIKRTDIPKDAGLNLNTDRGKITFSLEDTRNYIRKSCHSCADPTSELADLSIGSIESDTEWCTLIIRTEKGADLVKKAITSDLLEVKTYSAEALKALREASLVKKKRVLQTSETPNSPEINNSYLRFSDETCNRIKGEGE